MRQMAQKSGNREAHDEAINQLYEGPLERFTAERNALAKRLRAEGDKTAAQRVAKLRKPTVAAWVVNQIAHQHRKDMDRFLAAVDDLQRAQDAALGGKGGEQLRKAMRAERDAIDTLIEVGRSVSDSASESTLDRVRETLGAAAADTEAREAVRAGRLDRELQPGRVTGPTKNAAGAQRRPRPGPAREEKSDERSRREEEIASLRQELADLRKGLEEAEEVEAQRRDDKDQAEERLGQARAGLREAREATRKIHAQVRSAQQRLDRKRRR
jgi:hypothetical protein